MEDILTFLEQNQTEVAIVVGILVLLLLVWLVARAMRSRSGRERTVERPTATVRRPVYTDPELLEDLLATAQGRARRTGGATGQSDAPSEERTDEPTTDDSQAPEPVPATADVRPVEDGATTTSDVDPDRDPARRDDAARREDHAGATSASSNGDGNGRGDDTRRVAETLAALEGSDVLIDLDAHPDADLIPGKAVVLTGTLERHPASDAAEILELSAPLLHRGAGNGGGSVTSGGAEGATADGAPLVVRLAHPIDSRDYLMVLPREHLRVEDPTRLGSRVSVLAVVERSLGKRETVDVEDYLRPHLSRDGQEVLRDRDLGETIATLSQVASEDLGADDLPFRGPGALLTPAAIQR